MSLSLDFSLARALRPSPLARRFWVLAIVAAAAGAWMLAELTPERRYLSSRLDDVVWAEAAPGDVAPPAEGAWRDYDRFMGLERRAVWMRASFELSEAERATAALALSGVFAARVYLNGAEIGAKGAPGLTAETEVPGPVDAAIPLGEVARAGTNELVVFISAHHAGYRPSGLLHGVSILPHGGEASRPISQYAIALSQVGVLVALAVAFAFAAARWRERALAWAACGAGFLLIALAAETARTWWNYPYPLHVVRLTTVWLALTGYGLAVVCAAAVRFGVKLPAVLVAGGALALTLAASFLDGIDWRTQAALIALALTAIGVAAPRAHSGDTAARILIGVLAATTAMAIARLPQFIDNWVYILGAATLAVFAWRSEPVAQAEASSPPLVAAEEDIVLVRAAGNYAEIHTADGRARLVRSALADFDLAGPLMRIHRSYIVNLDHSRRVVAKTGSRYELELSDGATIPVSRKLVDAVRAALAERLTRDTSQ